MGTNPAIIPLYQVFPLRPTGRQTWRRRKNPQVSPTEKHPKSKVLRDLLQSGIPRRSYPSLRRRTYPKNRGFLRFILLYPENKRFCQPIASICALWDSDVIFNKPGPLQANYFEFTSKTHELRTYGGSLEIPVRDYSSKIAPICQKEPDLSEEVTFRLCTVQGDLLRRRS